MPYSIFNRFTRPKAEMSLGINNNQLFFGNEINGIVKFNSQENFDVEDITVWLLCVESVKKVRKYQETVMVRQNQFDDFDDKPETQVVWREKEYFDRATLFSDHVQVCGPMPAIIGLTLDFPFTFKLPLIGRETYHSVDSSVRWSVSAIMESKGRKQIHAKGGGEILVAKPSTTTTVNKEVIREVVLIPCAYCGGLMPQTSIFCPNCGARRRA